MKRAQLLGLVAGLPFVAYGVGALLRESSTTHPRRALAWVLGAALGHDLLLAPIVICVGAVVARFPLRHARAWVAAGLFLSGAVALYAWPSVRGDGRLANNPSLLPRNYAIGLALTLIFVWVILGVGALVTRLRAAPATTRGGGRSRRGRGERPRDLP